jgi:hypothetical protein
MKNITMMIKYTHLIFFLVYLPEYLFPSLLPLRYQTAPPTQYTTVITASGNLSLSFSLTRHKTQQHRHAQFHRPREDRQVKKEKRNIFHPRIAPNPHSQFYTITIQDPTR